MVYIFLLWFKCHYHWKFSVEDASLKAIEFVEYIVGSPKVYIKWILIFFWINRSKKARWQSLNVVACTAHLSNNGSSAFMQDSFVFSIVIDAKIEIGFVKSIFYLFLKRQERKSKIYSLWSVWVCGIERFVVESLSFSYYIYAIAWKYIFTLLW